MKGWGYLFAASGFALATACARPVHIEAVGVQPPAKYPRTIYEFNYGFDDAEYFDQMDRRGSVRFAFETRDDLQRLAKGWQVHHMYYQLFDCSHPERYESGDIFPLASEGKAHRYEAYLPARYSDLDYLGEHGMWVKWPVQESLVNGLCFKVQGGSMAGLGIGSNTIRADELLSHFTR